MDKWRFHRGMGDLTRYHSWVFDTINLDGYGVGASLLLFFFCFFVIYVSVMIIWI